MGKPNHLQRLREINEDLDQELPIDVLLRLLVELMTDGMAIVNKEGTIMTTNASMEATFGYGKGELVGVHINLLIPKDLRK